MPQTTIILTISQVANLMHAKVGSIVISEKCRIDYEIDQIDL